MMRRRHIARPRPTAIPPYTVIPIPHPPSFPRKQESTPRRLRPAACSHSTLYTVIPAKAGIHTPASAACGLRSFPLYTVIPAKAGIHTPAFAAYDLRSFPLAPSFQRKRESTPRHLRRPAGQHSPHSMVKGDSSHTLNAVIPPGVDSRFRGNDDGVGCGNDDLAGRRNDDLVGRGYGDWVLQASARRDMAVIQR